MDSTKIDRFLTEIDKLERSGSRDSKTKTFAYRARQEVVKVYRAITDDDWKLTGEYEHREGTDTTTADKLVEMGATEAVYGRGRVLLRY